METMVRIAFGASERMQQHPPLFSEIWSLSRKNDGLEACTQRSDVDGYEERTS